MKRFSYRSIVSSLKMFNSFKGLTVPSSSTSWINWVWVAKCLIDSSDTFLVFSIGITSSSWAINLLGLRIILSKYGIDSFKTSTHP